MKFTGERPTFESGMESSAMSRKISTYENNSMSLSCCGEMVLDGDNIVVSSTFKGYPRAGGVDAWVCFYKNASVGDKIEEARLDHMLSLNGRNNIVSKILPHVH